MERVRNDLIQAEAFEFDPNKEASWRNLEDLTKLLKRNTLRTIEIARVGHVGACCSSCELISVLYFTDILQINSNNPKDPDRDIVLLRGHLGPLRYNVFNLFGWLSEQEMSQYRKFGSRLPGHEDMNVTPGVDITPSGSLGMVLSYAVGAGLSFRERGMKNKVFCFVGDGEEQEGNISEAARHAANLRLNNLICIIDKNGKQLSTSTSTVDGRSDLKSIWSGYGWKVLEIKNGHDVREIYARYKEALDNTDGPVCIIANTIKGYEIPGAEENYNGYHVYHGSDSHETNNQVPINALLTELDNHLIGRSPIVPFKRINRSAEGKIENSFPEINILPNDTPKIATSYDFLDQYLDKLGQLNLSNNIYVLTADYPPRGFVYGGGKFKHERFNYYNVGIREQHLFSMVHGIQRVEDNAVSIVLCGDAFVYRHADQLNVLAQAGTPVIIYSVESGISAARNGPTHQSSGQPGMILTMSNVDFYEPSSGRDLFYSLNKAINNRTRPVYIRTNRSLVPIDFGESQPANWYEITKTSENNCVIITNGMIVPEASKAIERLQEEGIKTKLVNALQPNNLTGISRVIEDNKPLFIFYNGNPDVLALPIAKEILVNGGKKPSMMITSGFTQGKTGSVGELMKYLKLDEEGIYNTVRDNL
jgi:transketolase